MSAEVPRGARRGTCEQIPNVALRSSAMAGFGVGKPAEKPAVEPEERLALAGPVDRLEDKMMEWLAKLAKPEERLVEGWAGFG